MDLNVPVVGSRFMTWVAYGDNPDTNGLFLAQFAEGFIDEENMQVQVRESMRQGGQRDWEDIEVEQSENHELQINDSPATFLVARGRGSRSKDEVWQVSGTFRGKGGPAMLFLKVREADFTKEQIIALLDSMK
jgi:hypothetical protein